MKIVFAVGARPNFMKIAPIVGVVRRNNSNNPSNCIDFTLVHTGQHYDQGMSKVFFRDLGLPRPDIYLGVGSASHAVQTAKIMVEFEKVCFKEEPDILLVVGDVNSTIACSLVAVKLGIRVAHVEAGLRSFDRTMPEEVNRILTDAICDYLFTTCEDANKNLKDEGIPDEKIFFVGNVMADTLLSHKDRAEESEILRKLDLISNNNVKKYAVLTLHRPSNVDNRETFQAILSGLEEVSGFMPIIFPVHPRTKKQIETFNLEKYFDYSSTIYHLNGIYLIEPLGYLDFLRLMSNAKLVFTDSGGIQEETTILGIPCLTIRKNTERPVTTREGTNRLVGTDGQRIVQSAMKILNRGGKKGKIPKLWDGKASERIVKILMENHAS